MAMYREAMEIPAALLEKSLWRKKMPSWMVVEVKVCLRAYGEYENGRKVALGERYGPVLTYRAYKL